MVESTCLYFVITSKLNDSIKHVVKFLSSIKFLFVIVVVMTWYIFPYFCQVTRLLNLYTKLQDVIL